MEIIYKIKNRGLSLLCFLGMLVMSMSAVAQSSPSTKGNAYSKTEKYDFLPGDSKFVYYGVGKVILKVSPDSRVHCEVQTTGRGRTEADAKANVDNVQVESSQSRGTISFRVKLARGVYNERRCKIVTTVYLPGTVTFQYNDDLDIWDYINRIVEKILR